MKLYLLFWGYEDDDSREAWSIFYTPCEIFTDLADRKARKKFLKKQDPNLCFEEQETVVMTKKDLNTPLPT